MECGQMLTQQTAFSAPGTDIHHAERLAGCQAERRLVLRICLPPSPKEPSMEIIVPFSLPDFYCK
jgi:hypothetical protein